MKRDLQFENQFAKSAKYEPLRVSKFLFRRQKWVAGARHGRVLKRFLWKALGWRDFVNRDFCWPWLGERKKKPGKVISSTIQTNNNLYKFRAEFLVKKIFWPALGFCFPLRVPVGNEFWVVSSVKLRAVILKPDQESAGGKRSLSRKPRFTSGSS